MLHIYIAAILAVIAVILFSIARKQDIRASGYNQYVVATRASELGAGVPAFFGGLVAVTGGQKALTSPYSKQSCVWYDYVIEQEVTNRDSDGMERTEWRVVSEPAASGVRFSLMPEGDSDEEPVYVDPSNADVNNPQQYEQMLDVMPTQVGEATSLVSKIVNATAALGGHRSRVRERYIAIGQHIYAGGVCTESQDKKLFANDAHYPLVLTTQSKADLVKSSQKASAIKYTIAAVLGSAAVAVFFLLKK